MHLSHRRQARPAKALNSWPACLLWFVLMSSICSAMAGDTSHLELTDGSIVIGEVLGMHDGIYRIRTSSLGNLDIEASRIRAIRSNDSTTPADVGSINPAANPTISPISDYGAEIESLKRQMLGNADLMQMILALQDDPALQQALSDPQLQGLIASGNLNAISQHPRFRELLEHPGIRAVIKQMQIR